MKSTGKIRKYIYLSIKRKRKFIVNGWQRMEKIKSNTDLVLLFETVLAVDPKSKFIQGEIAAGRMKILALKP
jgi:hypothetical protein